MWRKSLSLAIVRILMKPATDNAGNPVSSPGSIRPMAAPGNEETAVVTYSTVGSSAL